MMPVGKCTQIQKAWDEKYSMKDLRIIPIGAAALLYGDREEGGGGLAGWDLGRWCLGGGGGRCWGVAQKDRSKMGVLIFLHFLLLRSAASLRPIHTRLQVGRGQADPHTQHVTLTGADLSFDLA